MIPGTSITLVGQDYLIPPLTLTQLQGFLPRLRELIAARQAAGIDGLDQEHLGMMVEIITAAMQRNYPEITADQVGNLLDLGNAPTVLKAVVANALDAS